MRLRSSRPSRKLGWPVTALNPSEHSHAQEARDLSRPPFRPRGSNVDHCTRADLPALTTPNAPAGTVRIPSVPELSSPPAATGAAAGNLHLTPAEQEAVAAYLARIWPGATGLNKVPAPDMLAALVETTLRKAREQIAGRETITDADLPY